MKRKLLKKLIEWKEKKGRKPLILSGARQVGKTYLLEAFGEGHFTQFHRINFEKRPDACRFFKTDLDPVRIVRDLGVYLKKEIKIGEDLLILDEIQACPKAITSLKYFCEDLPELAVCAAGSLLGLELTPASYPVGKVDLMDLFPMCFMEFLNATGNERYVSYIDDLLASPNPQNTFHTQLWDFLKVYFIIGGLPEVVATYCEHQENPVVAYDLVRKKQRELINQYHADIAKHAGKVNAMHIQRVWNSIPTQLSRSLDGGASKFRFKSIIPGVKRYQQLVSVIDWLDKAGLIIQIPIAFLAELPLIAYTKENSFKLVMFDVGILGAMSDLAPETILSYEYGSYKGYFAENFVAQEFTSQGVEKLYGWHEGNSEVEFLRQMDGKIIPVEVKSGWVTKAKSLQTFSNKYHPPYQVILSGKNLALDQKKHTQYYPLYLAGQIGRN